jgi:hypothetical protein
MHTPHLDLISQRSELVPAKTIILGPQACEICSRLALCKEETQATGRCRKRFLIKLISRRAGSGPPPDRSGHAAGTLQCLGALGVCGKSLRFV